MLLNNLRDDLEGIARSEGISKSEFGRRAGMSRQNLEGLLARPYLTPRMIEALEMNGYDVEIVIRKK